MVWLVVGGRGLCLVPVLSLEQLWLLFKYTYIAGVLCIVYTAAFSKRILSEKNGQENCGWRIVQQWV